VSVSRPIFRRSLRRRLVVGAVLLAYLVAATGFPTPAAASRNDGEAFPCQGHRCGCQSAEQCRRQCCCFSPEVDACCKRKASESPSPGSRQCPIVSPLRCQGLTVLWAAATAGFAPPPVWDWQPSWPLVGSIALTDHKFCQITSLPSTPPPRLVAG
jgi:hypothetical protein